MSTIPTCRRWPIPQPRTRAGKLAAAHGHYVDEARDPNRMIGSWLIHREELLATGADYVALGHWNQSIAVGNGDVNAHYSGSPEYTGTVNVVKFQSDGQSPRRHGQTALESSPSPASIRVLAPHAQIVEASTHA